MVDVKKQRAILIIDDEPQVVEALADILEEDFRIIPMTSAEAALNAIANDKDIAVVLCDQRMPKMTGDELLSRAKTISSATRLMITGYADLEAVVRAVNDGQIFGYISKPWNPTDLRASVKKAIDYHDLLGELEQEQALLRNLMKFSPDGIAFKDAQGKYIRLNTPILSYLGIEDENDILGKRADEILPPEKAKMIIETEKKILSSKKPELNIVDSYVDKDGQHRWYSVNSTPILDQSEDVVGLIGINRDITELRAAEMEAKILGDRLRDAVDSMQDSFTLYDSNDKLILTNTRWQHLDGRFNAHMQVGVAFEETLRTAIEFGIYDDLPEDVEEWVRDRMDHFHRGDGSPVELRTKDQKWHLIRSKKTSDGGTVLIRTDITALKNIQAELTQRAREQTAIAEFGQAALAELDLNQLFTNACRLIADHLGITKTKVLVQQPDGDLLLVAGVGWRRDYMGVARVPSGRRSIGGYAIELSQAVIVDDWESEERCEQPALLRDHAVRGSVAVPIIIDGAPFGVFGGDCGRPGTFTDTDVAFITAVAHILAMAVGRIQANDALSASEQRFRDFAHCSADWFWESDMEQRITYFSGTRHVFNSLHPDNEMWVGKTRMEFLKDVNPTPDPVPIINDYMQRSEPFENLEYTFIQKDGVTQAWVSLSGVPILGKDGNVVAYRGIGSDITARKSAEIALQRSLERFESAARASSAGLWDWDAATNQVYYSPRFCQLLGLAPENAEPTLDFVRSRCNSDDIQRVRECLQRHIDFGEPLELECRMRHADGKDRWFHVVGEAVLDGSRQPVRMCGSIQDITDKRAAEEQLRQAQKMDAIGNLTGGVAHDFNNMLTVMLGNLDILADMVSDDPAKLDLVTAALQAGERSADLTKQLLTFSRRQTLEPRKVDVNELVSGVVKLLGRTIGPEIAINLDLSEQVWPVRIDPSQLDSALANLAVNARDAMPKGGTLTIATSNIEVDEAYAEARHEMQPGRYVRVDVTDTGTGIPPDIRDRIFEPFFTTKEVGKGTGLGLAMVFGFLKQSGGHIAVYSEPGMGTCFRLYLPQDKVEAAPEAVASRRCSDVAKAGETILVVDDESAVRAATVTQLKSLGYQILEAEDGASALAELGREEHIDLLLTDVAMPGALQGPDLAKRALELRPSVKVLLMSGFSAGVLEKLHDEGLDIPLLGKPFRRDALAAAVRKAIDQ